MNTTGADPVATRIPPWAAEMSSYIKSLDPNHLVAVGDEGFLCEPFSASCFMEYCECYAGTDFSRMTALPSIDFGSAQLYPQTWAEGTKDAVVWANEWIINHTTIAAALGKPMVIGEFGWWGNRPSGGPHPAKYPQSQVYAQWFATAKAAGAHMMHWMNCGKVDASFQGDNGWYPNYDGFCVYCPNATDATPPYGDAGDPAACAALTKAALNA